MARSIARFVTIDRTDSDWRSLTFGAQGLYVHLLRQSRLNLVGTLDLMPQRWADEAAGITVEGLLALLAELEQRRYVIIDRVTSEVLIRTFTKHDLDPSRKSTSTIKGLWSAWSAVLSPTLRSQIVTDMPDALWIKVEKAAPAPAVQTRRSPPLEREAPSPSAREAASPSEVPVLRLPSNALVVTELLSPTGWVGGDPSAAPDAGTEAADIDDQALRRAANRVGRIRAGQRQPPPDDPERFAGKVTADVLADPDQCDALRVLLAAGLTADNAAKAHAEQPASWSDLELLDGPGPSSEPTTRPPLRPVGQRARCGTCADVGTVLDDNDVAHRCPDCNADPIPPTASTGTLGSNAKTP